MPTDFAFNDDFFIPSSGGTLPLNREKLIHDSMLMENFNILGKNNVIQKFIIPVSELKMNDKEKKLWLKKIINKLRK
jgi:hypothetical protein